MKLTKDDLTKSRRLAFNRGEFTVSDEVAFSVEMVSYPDCRRPGTTELYNRIEVPFTLRIYPDNRIELLVTDKQLDDRSAVLAAYRSVLKIDSFNREFPSKLKSTVLRDTKHTLCNNSKDLTEFFIRNPGEERVLPFFDKFPILISSIVDLDYSPNRYDGPIDDTVQDIENALSELRKLKLNVKNAN